MMRGEDSSTPNEGWSEHSLTFLSATNAPASQSKGFEGTSSSLGRRDAKISGFCAAVRQRNQDRVSPCEREPVGALTGLPARRERAAGASLPDLPPSSEPSIKTAAFLHPFKRFTTGGMPKLEHLTQHARVALSELETAVMRLHDVEILLDELELALKEDQEEIDNYTNDITDCCNRIEAIDKFVHDIHADKVPYLADKGAVLSEMVDEREEEKHSIDALREARACHEQQVRKLKIDHAALEMEKLVLHKKVFHVRTVCGL